MVAGAAARKRGSYKTSERIRSRLIDAAMAEFAIHGFEGASTRAIAARAGAHQPQINYHFDSKEALWCAVMDRMMEEIDQVISRRPAGDPRDPRDTVEQLIRALVHFAAARPELNRMMIHEASAPSDRLTWLVDTHIRHRFEAFRAEWTRMQTAGHGGHVPAALAYHLVIGAASLLHANAPEFEMLAEGRASDPATVDAHADAMVRAFIGG